MKCKRCYCEIPDNCNFCPSCGCKINPVSPFDVSLQAQRQSTTAKFLSILAVVIVAIACIAVFNTSKGGIVVDLLVTAAAYMIVPITFLFSKKTYSLPQIKKIVIINGLCVWLFVQIIRIENGMDGMSAAVFFWSVVNYVMLKRKLVDNHCDDEYSENNYERPKKDYREIVKIVSTIIFAVFVAVLVIGLIGSIFNGADSGLTPIAEPESGEILSGDEVADCYFDDKGRLCAFPKITINASNGESCVVKLKTRADDTYISFYVRAGDTVSVRVPREEYYVFFATGKTWYGEDQLFGESTSYSKDATIADFSEGSWEYTLYPVTGGNFSQTPIDKEDF